MRRATHGISVSEHQVDLAVFGAEVGGQELHSSPLQILLCGKLTQPATSQMFRVLPAPTTEKGDTPDPQNRAKLLNQARQMVCAVIQAGGILQEYALKGKNWLAFSVAGFCPVPLAQMFRGGLVIPVTGHALEKTLHFCTFGFARACQTR